MINGGEELVLRPIFSIFSILETLRMGIEIFDLFGLYGHRVVARREPGAS